MHAIIYFQAFYIVVATAINFEDNSQVPTSALLACERCHLQFLPHYQHMAVQLFTAPTDDCPEAARRLGRRLTPLEQSLTQPLPTKISGVPRDRKTHRPTEGSDRTTHTSPLRNQAERELCVQSTKHEQVKISCRNGVKGDPVEGTGTALKATSELAGKQVHKEGGVSRKRRNRRGHWAGKRLYRTPECSLGCF